MDEKTIDAFLSTLTMYQKAFSTFYKENYGKIPDFNVKNAVDMADGWWNGLANAVINVNKGGNGIDI